MLRPRRRLRDVPLGRRFAVAEMVENVDGTVDLIGVELLAPGGPVHGVGSPPEGDFWSLAELVGMAEADFELEGELEVPNKVGHPDEQTLVKNSIKAGELPEPKDGEMPAVGWLENVRIQSDRLIGDVKKVPKVVADLIETGAYRTRSVELSSITSQKSGKTYEWVVTGLAWLGGTMPAVRTLGDVAALYQGDVPVRRRKVIYQELEPERDLAMPAGVKTCSMKGVSGYSGGLACHIHDGSDSGKAAALAKAKADVAKRSNAAGEIVWNPDNSLDAIRCDLSEALNGSSPFEIRWGVQDVTSDGKALVQDYNSPDYDDGYVIGWTRAADGTIQVDPVSGWTKVEKAWVATAKSYRDAADLLLTVPRVGGDTRPRMRYTVEQIRKFAEATGLKAEDVTEKMLLEAGVAETKPAEGEGTGDEPAEGDPKPEGEAKPAEGDETGAATERENAQAARITALEKTLQQNERREFVDAQIKAGKIAPGQRETLETLFDRDADAARKFVADLKPREDLLEELGSDDGERELEAVAGRSYVYENDATARLGIPKDSLV